MTPALSVVVPTHQRFDLLEACLRSLAQFSDESVEIIVVIDGSLNAHLDTLGSRLNVVRLATRSGFCVAANIGIRAARAPIVQLLNDDAEVTANWAAPALAAFAEPRIGAVAPLVIQWHSPTRVDSAGDNYSRLGFAQPRGRNRPVAEFQQASFVDAASGCAAFYRRSAIVGIGAFDETFGSHFEDVDLSCRLRRAGHLVKFVPESVVKHHGHASFGPPEGELLARQSCNEERLFWRHRRNAFDVLGHAGVLAAKAGKRLMEGNLAPWLRGRLRAVGQIATE